MLDHGEVELIDHMGHDLRVADAARVSFHTKSDWDEDEWGDRELAKRDKKLIQYLARENHWTPFAHCMATVRVKAPVSIRTQFFKHKQGFVENEVSRRYVTNPPEFYMPRWRNKPNKGAKQGSSGFLETEETRRDLTRNYDELVQQAVKAYDEAIEAGIAPEQARFLLPQGMYTEWYWTGSLAAFARFFIQRTDPHAQWEIQQYAYAIRDLIAPVFPVSWKMLTERPDA